jgi:hypothetical protein
MLRHTYGCNEKEKIKRTRIHADTNTCTLVWYLVTQKSRAEMIRTGSESRCR